jgi:hypothetical protein
MKRSHKRAIKKDHIWDDVAVRCRALRVAFEGDEHGAQAQFAKRIGVEITSWNNVENSFALSRTLAFRLVEVFPGLSLDWLYYGRLDGLSVKMFELLDAGRFSGEDKTLPRE